MRAIPEAVGHAPSGYLTLSDRPIEAALVNAVKQLKEANDRQSAEIAALRTRIAVLESAHQRIGANDNARNGRIAGR